MLGLNHARLLHLNRAIDADFDPRFSWFGWNGVIGFHHGAGHHDFHACCRHGLHTAIFIAVDIDFANAVSAKPKSTRELLGTILKGVNGIPLGFSLGLALGFGR